MSEEQREEKSKSRKKKILLTLLAILLMILLLLFTFLFKQKEVIKTKSNKVTPFQENVVYSSTTSDEESEDYVISMGEIKGRTVTEITKELQKKVDSSRTNVSLNATPCLDENGYYNVLIQNMSKENMSYTLELVDKETSVTIWEPKLLTPGHSISKVRFKKPLLPGKRECIYKITARKGSEIQPTTFNIESIFYT